MAFLGDEKARNVLVLIYTEDIICDEGQTPYGRLLQFLDGLQIPCACSCVHDQDTFTEGDIMKWIADRTDKESGELDKRYLEKGVPKEGQHKKEHIHILLRYPGPVTEDSIINEFAPLLKNGLRRELLRKCKSPSASLRYFSHVDSPEKHYYGVLSVKGFGGIDLSPLLKTDKSAAIETLLDVYDFIETHEVRHYNKLVKWAMGTADLDVISCVCGRASFFASYFRDKSDERREKAEQARRQQEQQFD